MLTTIQQRCSMRGGQGGRSPPPPEFGRSVNPIRTRVGRICPSHYCQPPPPPIQKDLYTSAYKAWTSVSMWLMNAPPSHFF